MTDEVHDRLDRLESLVERQEETIERLHETVETQRARIAHLEGDADAPGSGAHERARQSGSKSGSRPSSKSEPESESEWRAAGSEDPPVTRRSALKAGGLLGLLGLGAGTAAADPQGKIGTAEDPLKALYTESIRGGVTAGSDGAETPVSNLVGENLSVGEGGDLEATDTHVTVSNSVRTVEGVEDIEAGQGLDVFGEGPSVTLAADVEAGGSVDTHTDVSDDGSTVVEDTDDVDFGANLAVTDDGDGSATVDATVGAATNWEEADSDDLLEPVSPFTGVDVTDVQTDSLNGGVTGDTDLTSLTGNGLTVASGSLGIASGGVTTTELASDTVTVAGNTVSLGGSTGIAHGDLSNVGSSDHHTRPSAGNALADNSDTFDVKSGGIGTTELNTPFADLAALFGGPVTAGGDLDMGASNAVALNTDDTGGFFSAPSQGHVFFGMAGDDGAYLFGQPGAGGSNDGEFVIRTQDDGTEEIKLQQHDSAGGKSPVTQLRIDESGNLRFNKDLQTESGTTVWDSSAGELGSDSIGSGSIKSGAVGASELANDSVTVANNSVSLGGSTGIAHGDLSNVGSSDHHTRPSAGSGLTENSGAFDVNTGSTTTVSSGSLDVASGSITGTEIAANGVTGTEIDLGTIAGKNVSVDTNNDELDVTGSMTVAGNSVSLGGSTAVDHADLSNVGSSDHHARPSAGNALADNSNTFDVKSGGIGSTELASGAVTGTEIDLTTIAGENITVDTSNDELDTDPPALTDADGDGLLEIDGTESGIDVDTVRATTFEDASGNSHLTLNDGGNFRVKRTLDLGANSIESSTGNPLVLTTNSGERTLKLGVPKSGAGGNIVAGHKDNAVNSAKGSVIGGGGSSGTAAAGGFDLNNTVSVDYGVIGGGIANRVSGLYSTVPGGYHNIADGSVCFAAGSRADTNGHRDVFIWSTESPSFDTTYKAQADGEVRFLAYGGFYIDSGGLFAPDLTGNTESIKGLGYDSSTGEFIYDTSSARYKTDIRPLEVDTSKTLDLEPKSFRDADSGREAVGLIAEEVDEIVPELALYDEDGRPDSVKYDRVATFLIPEIRENRERLDETEETLDGTDRRLADLERENQCLREKTDDLRAENEELRAENDRLHERVEAIEAELDIDAPQRGGNDD